jgi:hypothetical protein
MVVAPVLLILAASQVHCPGESGRAGRDRDPLARHADLETASISIALDFGRYRHAQEVTDSMSIETLAARASAAAAVALVRQRAPETPLPPDRGGTGAGARPSGLFRGESGRPHRPRAIRWLDLPGRPDQADGGTC